MIDIRTLMLVLAIGNFSFAILIAGYARAAVPNPALRAWMWAKIVQSGAHLLAWLRPDMPHLAGALAADITLVLGATAECAAYCVFFELKRGIRRLYLYAAISLLVLTCALVGGARSAQMTPLMSVIIGLLAAGMAYVLLRPSPGDAFLRRVIGINNALLLIALCWRAYVGVTTGTLTSYAPAAAQSFTYLTAFLLLIVNGFGFLLLCKEKDDRKMQRLATIDSLTGIANRHAFLDHAESARLLSLRMRQPVSLMMIDIDHFKGLNDRFGHACGDEALRVFAVTAQTALREHDVMGRLGGEEFAVVLPGTDLEGALQAAERLRAAVAALALEANGEGYSTTVSIGVVAIERLELVDAALARADHALYAAKSLGRNRVEVGGLALQAA